MEEMDEPVILTSLTRKDEMGENARYKVQSTEKLRPFGSSFETKALLYLAGIHDDSREMEFFIVDFFNDLTATDGVYEEVWDLQSKSEKGQSAKKVGEALVTLYKNHVSVFNFHHYILFMGGVTKKNLIDSTLKKFGIDNFTPEAQEDIVGALLETCMGKSYIPESDRQIDRIKEFIPKVDFIIDDRDETDYVKSLIRMKASILPDDDKLRAIFKYIQKEQSSKKEERCVEGKELERFQDFVEYDRHICSKDLRLVVINNILGYDLLKGGMPVRFRRYLVDKDDDEADDFVEECKCGILVTLFDNSNADNFWRFFERLCTTIVKNPEYEIEHIFIEISPYLEKLPNLGPDSARYFISLAKEGLDVR